jgi:hypothetical protein
MMDHVWSVSLHPGGTSMALGMTDKLRVYMILKDDILEVVALPIRKCDVVRFSNGGKFFAAVNSRTNNIHVRSPHSTPLPCIFPWIEFTKALADTDFTLLRTIISSISNFFTLLVCAIDARVII